jgi:hypothetical protein
MPEFAFRKIRARKKRSFVHCDLSDLEPIFFLRGRRAPFSIASHQITRGELQLSEGRL